jgi:hypothetical protein
MEKTLFSFWIRRRATANERGASAVEFAILAPLFFMLVFGMFSGGTVFYERNNLVNASREGARFGATFAIATYDSSGISSGTLWAEKVRDITIDRGYGDLGATVAGRVVCVAVVEGSGAPNGGKVLGTAGTSITTKGTFYSWTGASAPGSPVPCYNDGGSDGGRRVQVMVRRSGQINAVLFAVNVTVQGQASARHEQQP